MPFYGQKINFKEGKKEAIINNELIKNYDILFR